MATLLGIESGRVATVATFYKASALLGVGRYSEVYKAFDTNSQTDVALKLYTGSDNAAHDRAKNEATLLTKLGTLNSEYFPVLRRTVKHRIKNQNHPLLVLELGAYVKDGQKHVLSLKDVVPHVPPELPWTDVGDGFWCISSLVRWMVHLLQAVKQLHSIGVVHRDIKPANILLKRGPGQSQAVPFVLDYNSASDDRESDSGSGTPRYLPPEVKLGKRTLPDPEDDLWAVAMVAWEMLYGQPAEPDRQKSPVSVIEGIVPDSLVTCLSRALNVNPELRYRSADEFAAALETCVTNELPGIGTLRSADVARARAEMDRIRQVVGLVLAPPGQIIVPKDIDDAVNTIFGWLSHDESQALNLVDEIVKLGPAAIPACLQQGYRLHAKVSSYDDVVVALGRLAAMDRSLAERCIDEYALSSNRGVRELCWSVCEPLQYFPEAFLKNLMSDEGLLLPEVRGRQGGKDDPLRKASCHERGRGPHDGRGGGGSQTRHAALHQAAGHLVPQSASAIPLRRRESGAHACKYWPVPSLHRRPKDRVLQPVYTRAPRPRIYLVFPAEVRRPNEVLDPWAARSRHADRRLGPRLACRSGRAG